ncbi:MAG: hypothetical protein WCO30_02825, partial [bacterium]
MNNSEGIVRFPTDLLEVVSVSKSSSIFPMWVEEPRFSNLEGSITFSGGLPNPGFNGSNGEIISFVLRAKTAGTASLIFSDAAVRANDGLGTDILSAKGTASFKISPATAVLSEVTTPVISPVTKTVTGEALTVKSITNPDQTIWYRNSDPVFSWNSVSGMSAIQTSYGPRSDSIPNVYYAKPILKKVVENVPDGAYYFNVRYKLNNVWSKTAHFAFKIDTTAPDNISGNSTVEDDGRVAVILKASDVSSGVDRFVVMEGNSTVTIPAIEGKGIYFPTPGLSSEKKDIMVTAYDKAGNSGEITLAVTLAPMSAPKITDYSKQINFGDKIQVAGITAYPEQQISIVIKSPTQKVDNFIVKSDKGGKFTFASEPMKNQGSYDLWAQVIGKNGEKGLQSQTVQSQVGPSETKIVIKKIFDWIMTVLPLVGSIVVLILLAIYGWGKFLIIKRRNNKDLCELEKRMHDSYMNLIKEAEKQIASLQKSSQSRSLTEKEIEINPIIDTNQATS